MYFSPVHLSAVMYYSVSKNYPYCCDFFWYCVLGWVLVSLAGSMLHFAYQWAQCHWAVGFLVAVNESVFEHLKILVFPLLLFWFVDYLLFGHAVSRLISATFAIYSGVAFLVLIHVLVSVLAGYEGLVFDIVLFIVSAFVAQLAGYWSLYMQFRHWLWVLIIILCFVVAVICHVFFTVCPPHIPVLFQDFRGFYGIPELCYKLDFPSFQNTTPAHANVFFLTC